MQILARPGCCQALEILKSMTAVRCSFHFCAKQRIALDAQVDQRRVISAGTMSGGEGSQLAMSKPPFTGCRDPVAVIQTRAKKASGSTASRQG